MSPTPTPAPSSGGRRTSAAAVALLLSATPALAQRPEPLPAAARIEAEGAPAHAVPFASKGNRLELAVAFSAPPGKDAVVRVAEAPAWVTFATSAAPVGAAGEPDEAPVQIAFDVAREAPVGTVGVVRLVVESAGRTVAEHAFRLVAEPPREVALDAPWPSPSRGPITFGFALPEPGPAVLTVYDALGREVARIDSGDRPAGYTTTRWETPGAAGFYVVRLRAGGSVRTRTFVQVN